MIGISINYVTLQLRSKSLAERKTPLSGDMYCSRRDVSIIKSLTCRNINNQKRNRCNKPHIHILHFIK